MLQSIRGSAGLRVRMVNMEAHKFFFGDDLAKRMGAPGVDIIRGTLYPISLNKLPTNMNRQLVLDENKVM